MLGKVELKCPICGDVYYRYPSEKKKTCGKAECVRVMRKRYWLKLPSVGTCSECGRKMKLKRKGRSPDRPPLCRKCFDKLYRTGGCAGCGEVRMIYSKGHCFNCYMKLGLNRKVVCKRCGRTRPHYAKGLCNSCYHMRLLKEKNDCGARNRTSS